MTTKKQLKWEEDLLKRGPKSFMEAIAISAIKRRLTKGK
jgi:hypothetical protein